MNATTSERDAPATRSAHVKNSWASRLFRVLWFLFVSCIFLGAIGFACFQTESLRPLIHEIQSIARGTLIETGTGEADLTPPSEMKNSEMVPYVESVQAELSSSSRVKRTFSGVLKPAQSSKMGFNRTGRVTKILVDQGDRVAKNQLLAELDTRATQAEIDIAKSQLKSARALLRELKAGPRIETIAAAKEKLKEYQSSVELWRITANRRNKLVRESAGSQQSVDDARLQLAASEGRFNSQVQVVKELENGTRREKIDNQVAVVEGLTFRLQQLEVDLDDCFIRAPFEAIVSERMVDLGVIVTPAHVILKLVQETHPEAWIGLPPKTTGTLELDSKYELFIDGQPAKATLQSVLPELDASTRTQTAIFAIDSDLPNPGFGRIVRFDWSDEQTINGCWLPRTALSHGIRGLWSVFAVADDGQDDSENPQYVLQRRDVEIVQIESDQVLVRGTIERGDRVVSSGVHRLVAGQKVRLHLPDSKNETRRSFEPFVPNLN